MAFYTLACSDSCIKLFTKYSGRHVQDSERMGILEKGFIGEDSELANLDSDVYRL